MSTLSQAVDDYLAMRRALGYKLIDHGRVLPQFVAFLEEQQAPLITTRVALRFAMQPAQANVVWWHQRLAIVRGFAVYMQAFDARHEVPPANLLPVKFRRAVPYLFSEAEIEALMRAARGLRPPLRAAGCEALIGLLAVTGMSEQLPQRDEELARVKGLVVSEGPRKSDMAHWRFVLAADGDFRLVGLMSASGSLPSTAARACRFASSSDQAAPSSARFASSASA